MVARALRRDCNLLRVAPSSLRRILQEPGHPNGGLQGNQPGGLSPPPPLCCCAAAASDLAANLAVGLAAAAAADLARRRRRCSCGRSRPPCRRRRYRRLRRSRRLPRRRRHRSYRRRRVGSPIEGGSVSGRTAAEHALSFASWRWRRFSSPSPSWI